MEPLEEKIQKDLGRHMAEKLPFSIEHLWAYAAATEGSRPLHYIFCREESEKIYGY